VSRRCPKAPVSARPRLVTGIVANLAVGDIGSGQAVFPRAAAGNVINIGSHRDE
jgi:hypothetical protein